MSKRSHSQFSYSGDIIEPPNKRCRIDEVTTPQVVPHLVPPSAPSVDIPMDVSHPINYNNVLRATSLGEVYRVRICSTCICQPFIHEPNI